MLPADLLRDMQAPIVRSAEFEMADGRVVEMSVGEARVALNGLIAPTQVIFGPDGSQALLGALTLQELELVVDTPNERLARDVGPFHV